MKARYLPAVLSLVVALNANADVDCIGTVVSTGVQYEGSVTLSLLIAGVVQPEHYICNVISQVSGTSTYKMDPIACRAAVSTLLTARGSATNSSQTTPVGATVKVKYQGSISSCTIAAGTVQPAYSIRLITP